MIPILFHTSKTMSEPGIASTHHTLPAFQAEANVLHSRLLKMSTLEIKNLMKTSDKLTNTTVDNLGRWTHAPKHPAIHYFSGDIYTHLNANSLSDSDLEYAQERLLVLSGLYGILRPLDLISPYRLEMGYRLQVKEHPNLYSFWKEPLAKVFPQADTYLHLSSEEYFKSVRHLIPAGAKVIQPIFLTKKDGNLKQVTIHSKLARGAYVNWLIEDRTEDLADLRHFSRLDYQYSPTLSGESNPTYIRLG